MTHLLDHANELREGPVELVEDTVEEAGGHVRTLPQQVCHVLLQQGGGAGLCGHRAGGGGGSWASSHPGQWPCLPSLSSLTGLLVKHRETALWEPLGTACSTSRG